MICRVKVSVDELAVSEIGSVIVCGQVCELVLVWDGGGDALVVVGGLKVVLMWTVVVDGCVVGLFVVTCCKCFFWL